MRLVICLIPLLCGCTSPAVRCDTHLLPINAPVANANAAGATHTGGAKKAAAVRGAP